MGCGVWVLGRGWMMGFVGFGEGGRAAGMEMLVVVESSRRENGVFGIEGFV